MTITLTREEAQQVLDALEAHADIGLRAEKAIETLRARLAQPETDMVQDAIVCGTGIAKDGKRIDPASIYKEPEPVAVWELQEGGWDTIADRDWMESLPVGTKLYTAPPRSEPTKLLLIPALMEQAGWVRKREWQGLTDEEAAEVERWVEFKEEGSGRIPTGKLIRYIEAKLKEKNT
jgi:hypothetical protein